MPSTSAPAKVKVEVRCECGFKARVGEELTGRRVKCKGCGESLVVGKKGPGRPKPPASPAEPAPPARERSEKNVLVGAGMTLWGVGTVLHGANQIAGSSGGADSTSLFFAALLSGVILLPVGLKTLAVGVQRIHVPGQDLVYAPAKAILGAVLLLGSAWQAIDAAAAIASGADGNTPLVVLGVGLVLALCGGALVANAIRAGRAAPASEA